MSARPRVLLQTTMPCCATSWRNTPKNPALMDDTKRYVRNLVTWLGTRA